MTAAIDIDRLKDALDALLTEAREHPVRVRVTGADEAFTLTLAREVGSGRTFVDHLLAIPPAGTDEDDDLFARRPFVARDVDLDP